MLWIEISPDLKCATAARALNIPHTCICQLSAKMGKKGSIRYSAREYLGLETGPEGCQQFKVKLVVNRQDLYREPLPVLSIPGNSRELVHSHLSFFFPSTSWILKEQTPGPGGVLLIYFAKGSRCAWTPITSQPLPHSYLALA